MKYCVKIGNLYVNYICIGNQKNNVDGQENISKRV